MQHNLNKSIIKDKMLTKERTIQKGIDRDIRKYLAMYAGMICKEIRQVAFDAGYLTADGKALINAEPLFNAISKIEERVYGR